MVKIKKNSEFITPADHFRKKEKKKEIERNRKERHLNRIALSDALTNPDELRKELDDLLEAERAGKILSKSERLRKKVYVEQFKASIRRNFEEQKRLETEPFAGSLLESNPVYPKKEALGSATQYNEALPSPATTSELFQYSVSLHKKTLKPESSKVGASAPQDSTITVTMSQPVENCCNAHLLKAASHYEHNFPKRFRGHEASLATENYRQKSSTISAPPTVKATIPATQNKELLSLVPSSVRMKQIHSSGEYTNSKPARVCQPALNTIDTIRNPPYSRWIRQDTDLEKFMKKINDLETL